MPIFQVVVLAVSYLPLLVALCVSVQLRTSWFAALAFPIPLLFVYCGDLTASKVAILLAPMFVGCTAIAGMEEGKARSGVFLVGIGPFVLLMLVLIVAACCCSSRSGSSRRFMPPPV